MDRAGQQQWWPIQIDTQEGGGERERESKERDERQTQNSPLDGQSRQSASQLSTPRFVQQGTAGQRPHTPESAMHRDCGTAKHGTSPQPLTTWEMVSPCLSYSCSDQLYGDRWVHMS